METVTDHVLDKTLAYTYGPNGQRTRLTGPSGEVSEYRYDALNRVRQSKLLAALSEQGQRSPVLVVGAGEPNRYVLIDGYRRVPVQAGSAGVGSTAERST